MALAPCRGGIQSAPALLLMFPGLERHVTTLVLQYGAPALFAGQVLGIAGLPVPDELLLASAGALVARGKLDGRATVTAAIAGCLCGITVSYVLGRVVGLRVLRAAFRHQEAFDRAEALFARFGGGLLAGGYFIPGVRHVTAIAAGSSEFSYARFAGYAYPGGVVWCSVFLGLGYYGGERWEEVARAAMAHLMPAAAVILCVVVDGAVLRYVVERRARG